MSEITNLRKRAEAIGCRIRVFRRKDYKCDGKPVRYSVVEPERLAWDMSGRPHRFQQEWYAANLRELRDRVEQVEQIERRRVRR